jgi:(S)-2-hydroxy-acid oxidase
MSKDVVKVDEFEALAKKKMPKMAFDYYASGAEDEHTLQQNRDAFSRIRLRPRILVDVSSVNTSTTVLGFRIAMPIMVAPAALHKLAHPEGEVATARAVSAADTIMILSTTSSCSMEEVAAAAPGVRFFQLYVYKDRQISQHLVRRAEEAGFSALVLTVDTPRLGRREADLKNNFTLPPHIANPNMEAFVQHDKKDRTGSSMLASWADKLFDRSLSWKDVKWLKSITKLPIILKGILNGEDGKHCCSIASLLPATITVVL